MVPKWGIYVFPPRPEGPKEADLTREDRCTYSTQMRHVDMYIYIYTQIRVYMYIYCMGPWCEVRSMGALLHLAYG